METSLPTPICQGQTVNLPEGIQFLYVFKGYLGYPSFRRNLSRPYLAYFYFRYTVCPGQEMNITVVLPNPGIMVIKGNYPREALFQVSELL